MNAQERDTVRALIDHAKRERLERATRPAPAPVFASVHYLPSYQPAPPPRPEIEPEPVPSVGRCVFCGGRTKSDVCRAHQDLVA